MVDALIVTYGNRWEFLREVISFLLTDNNIQKIIIIDNHSSYSVADKINELGKTKIVLIELDGNYGSAYGYKKGLEYLNDQSGTNLIWMLDDDNLPAPDCLQYMLQFRSQLEDEKKDDKVMLMAMRKNRSYLERSAKMGTSSLFFPRYNHFFGFNLFRPDIWLMKKIYAAFILPKKTPAPFLEIPCAPYGGLLFHKNILKMTGLPDERFFTYSDDFDFSIRFTRQKGTIYLISDAVVTDIDQPLINQGRKGLFGPKFLDMEQFRLFFLVRNTVYFTKKYFVTNSFIFTVNRVVYTAYFKILSLMYNKNKPFRLFRDAVKKGLAGNFDNAVITGSEAGGTSFIK